MLVYVPDGVKVGDTVFLWNEGGKADPSKTLLAFDLARRAKVPVAFLYGIPKQPLFEGKKEDALISETFVRYLKTEDEDWPLLFPMVKSLVRAMDVVQEFATKEWKADVKSFVVSGASRVASCPAISSCAYCSFVGCGGEPIFFHASKALLCSASMR